MANSNRRDTGRPPGGYGSPNPYAVGDEIALTLGSAERKAQTLADTPSEFAAPGNPYTVTTMAPPVDAPKAKMARGAGRRPLI
jgi:hypothetical protein